MTENPYEQIDDLFAKIRLRLALVRQSDPATAAEIKDLITQLEDWVESIVVDALKLKSLESKPKRTARSEKKPPKRQGSQ